MPEKDLRLPLLEHLEEIRKRVFVVLAPIDGPTAVFKECIPSVRLLAGSLLGQYHGT